MIIGIPKEIKSNEYRVAITPAGVAELKKHQHRIIVQSGAGEGSGFKDQDYIAAGAEIHQVAKDVFASAEIILKVKEPIDSEYLLIHKDQVVFTYFHFASSEKLTRAMMASQAICIAYETVEKSDGTLPLLIPMSEVAGRMSVQQGAIYLEKQNQGKGILLGGVPGVRPAHVLILGAGIVGTQAAKMAAGLGARVTLMDISIPRLRYLNDVMPANVTTLVANDHAIRETIKTADLVIGAVLISGAKAPVLVSKDMLKTMEPGSVVIDVAVDQGGCIETCRPTTHADPTFIIDGIVHYCVANMPGAVPYTSTAALTNATLPFILQLADKGWTKACQQNAVLAKGLNIVGGKVVHEQIANAFKLTYTSAADFLS
jgi:alanine dehydrogenase